MGQALGSSGGVVTDLRYRWNEVLLILRCSFGKAWVISQETPS